jgi:hypothetical protein
MPLFWAIGVLMIATALTVATVEGEVASTRQEARLDVLSGSMITYRNAVQDFIISNPAVSGAVSNSQLPLPAWFKPDYRLRAYADNGRGMVYLVEPVPGLPSSLYKAYRSIYVGSSNNNQFQSVGPSGFASSLPGIIPDGVAVMIIDERA